MYICYELREIEDGALVKDVISKQGEPSFEIKFEELSIDQLQTIWEVTDKYLKIKKQNELKTGKEDELVEPHMQLNDEEDEDEEIY